MDENQHLEEYLAICKRIYESMQRDGSWPWGDSPNAEDLVESNDKSESI